LIDVAGGGCEIALGTGIVAVDTSGKQHLLRERMTWVSARNTFFYF
jgi:hypothetical protein